MDIGNRNRPFKIKVSTSIPRPRPIGTTFRKDRLKDLQKHQNTSASVLQNKWRANKARTDYNDLMSQPGEVRWRGDLLIGGVSHEVTCLENYVPVKRKGLVTYSAHNKNTLSQSPNKLEPLKLIRESGHPLSAKDAEKNCRHLKFKSGKLTIDYSGDLAAQPPDEDEVKLSKEGQADDNDEQQLETYQQIPFNKIRNAQFCVDGAIGLPVNCTATRVTAQIMEPSRLRIGPLVSTYSNPDSPMANPAMNLVVTWRREELLSPTLTVLCRVDTLERPSLKSAVVGYAALKLCVTESGLQPVESDGADGAKLNAGKFYIPINIGAIPEWGMLSEELIESLPPLPGAFLCVRLYDGSVDDPPSHIVPLPNAADPENGPNFGSGSRDTGCVADALYGSKVTDKDLIGKFQPLPLINSPAGKDFQKGVVILPEDREEIMRLLPAWIASTFAPYEGVGQYVTKKYLLRYDDSIGFLASVDGLHNMPPLRNVSPTTIIGHKVGLRYVCGEGKPVPWNGEPGDNPDHIIDDMSLQWDFEKSSQKNIIFLDDFRPIRYIM